MVRIGKQKAFLRGAEWRCASTPLEEELNRFTRSWVQREAPTDDLGADLEQAITREVAAHFQGKVLLRVNPRDASVEKRYFRLRQLDLFEM